MADTRSKAELFDYQLTLDLGGAGITTLSPDCRLRMYDTHSRPLPPRLSAEILLREMKTRDTACLRGLREPFHPPLVLEHWGLIAQRDHRGRWGGYGTFALARPLEGRQVVAIDIEPT